MSVSVDGVRVCECVCVSSNNDDMLPSTMVKLI